MTETDSCTDQVSQLYTEAPSEGFDDFFDKQRILGAPDCQACIGRLPCFRHFIEGQPPSEAPEEEADLEDPANLDDEEDQPDDQPETELPGEELQSRPEDPELFPMPQLANAGRADASRELLELWVGTHCACPAKTRPSRSLEHIHCIRRAEGVCRQIAQVAGPAGLSQLARGPFFAHRTFSSRAESPDSLEVDSVGEDDERKKTLARRFAALPTATSCDSLDMVLQRS